MKTLIEKIVPEFSVSCYHFLLAFFGALVCGFPSRKLIVIGITGTHGKTTTVNLAGEILEKAGYKVAVASSIKFRIAGKEEGNTLKMTMPGRAFLQRFLRKAVRAGCKYAVLEVTSEGVLQHRHRFIKFNIMVFTNLFREHLERHGGFENYKKAKGQYFKMCKGTHIVNLDDKNVEYFLRFPATKKLGYTVENNEPRIKNYGLAQEVKVIKAKEVQSKEKYFSFIIHNSSFIIPLIGRFNIYNALAAICIGLSQGISLETASKALAGAEGVPGRMEKVIDSPFKVFVDYAFTPDALEQVYKTLATNDKERITNNLICVLGACGGGRDKWKRKVLGEIAAKQCREVIVTNEDPYDEDPMSIINQVAEGAGGKVKKILDRREAIRKALELAKPGDAVIITGKGCEPWICVERGKKIPWDDRKVAREELEKMYEKPRDSQNPF